MSRRFFGGFTFDTRHGRVAVVGAVTAALGLSLAVASTAGAAVSAQTSGAPVILFQETPVDNPTLSFPNYRTGASIAAASVNRAGGIKGRPVEMFFCDDKNNVSVGANCAQTAVDNGAVARVGSLTALATTVTPILEAAGMADFGSVPSSPTENNTPIGFPIASGTTALRGYGQLLKERFPLAKVVVVVASGNVAGNQARADEIAASARAAGVTVADEILYNSTAADFSSYVGQAKRANPDVVLGTAGAADLLKWWKASTALGFAAPTMTTSAGITPTVIAAGAPASQAAVFSDYYPSYLSSFPAAAQFRREWATFAKGQPINRDAWVGWLAVKGFAELMNKAKNPPTRAGVLANLRSFKCATFLYLKCINFSAPGKFADAPNIRVYGAYLYTSKNDIIVPFAPPISVVV